MILRILKDPQDNSYKRGPEVKERHNFLELQDSDYHQTHKILKYLRIIVSPMILRIHKMLTGPSGHLLQSGTLMGK